MGWEKFLSNSRQGKTDPEDPSVGRSNFQRDFDRIVYCSAFRRLQDKAQVFPLAKSDFVRTRLTHSLEVSCVGRSLGTEIGLHLAGKQALPAGISPGDIGNIVAAACLAHDIGNPPFGHTGEAAIREWFTNTEAGMRALEGLNPAQQADFRLFEGNAQGFRILTRLQNSHNPGLQLTCATLASFTKYPRESAIVTDIGKGATWKKHGYFQAEKDLFDDVAQAVGLNRLASSHSIWSRHPLAFLMEAADDICYRINDLEDGARLKYVSKDETESLLLSIFKRGPKPSKLSSISNFEDRLGYLRAKAINELIGQIVELFMEKEEVLVRGEFRDSLIDRIPSESALQSIFDLSKVKIYKAKEVLEIEVPGFRVLAGLLEAFLSALNEVAEHGPDSASMRSKTILHLLPSQFLGTNREPDSDKYIRTLKVTDFISGMTDTFAVSQYKQITGMSLPNT